MNISIIIPNYNGEKLLSKNLPIVLNSVKDYTKGNVEIIIPDDPSTDNSKRVIEEFINSIQQSHIQGKTIENKNTRLSGFSKNVNRGVKHATGEILILLNSDVAPYPNFLKFLLKHFEDPGVFAVGCMDESYEGEETILRGRGLGQFERGFLVHRAGEVDKKDTLWVSGGSGAFRKAVWDKLGGLDTLYDPFYWEDIDLSYNALKSGYKIIFEPKSVVVHDHEKGVVKEKFSDQFVKKIAYKNQFIFVWKNITQAKFLLQHIFWMPYHFLRAFISGDWMFFLGFYQAVINLPKILESRRYAKKRFVKTDYEVFKQFIGKN